VIPSSGYATAFKNVFYFYQDLIKYTPEDSQDFVSLNEAFQSAQNFVNEYNVQGSILQNSISAEKLSDYFYSTN
jgi:hypothetical protein